MELFGWKVEKKDQKSEEADLRSFTPKEEDDGALTVTPGGAMGMFVDIEGSAKTEAELVTKYRNMYNQPECQTAVNKIVNEFIVKEPGKPVCEINLDTLNVSQKIKDAITREWRSVYALLNLNSDSYEIAQRFYVDGRLRYHVIIDYNNPKSGIQEIRYIDPRKLRKIRTMKPRRIDKIIVQEIDQEFFIFNDRGFKTTNATVASTSTQGLKITKDAIIEVNSGLTDANNQIVLGFLHKAIRPLNQLRMLEDATVIYRVARAAERRLFYIDVGHLPKAKAEQYLKDMMTKHKNRLVYDAQSGEVRDDRKFQTMYEDMWFPTRGGQGGTKIETLSGGQNLGELSDVNYFKSKLYEALNLPLSRLEQSSSAFNIGRPSEISRDELEFQKFVGRLRDRFSNLFLDALEKQLVLKGILTAEDWKQYKADVHFDFARDNYTAELKDAEILTERVTLAQEADALEGKYFSREFILRNILKMTDNDIAKMKAEIEAEQSADAENQPDPNSEDGPTYVDFDTEEPLAAPETVPQSDMVSSKPSSTK